MSSIEEIKAGIEVKGKRREEGVRKMWDDIEKMKKDICGLRKSMKKEKK